MSELAASPHIPVLLEESMELLAPRAGRTYVDATCGFGGHLAEIHRRTEGNSNLIGIDRDPQAITFLEKQYGDRARFVHDNYGNIRNTLRELSIESVDGGILADLGVSSLQLDSPERGFSFNAEGPLDMRMDTSQRKTAADLVNNLSESELSDIIFNFGEERHARRIARAIVAARPLTTTSELARLITQTIKSRPNSKWSDIHPATRTFQALRIATNSELEHLQVFLRDAIDILAPGARLVVISFHSLEDRIVKQIFKQAAVECVCPPRQPICTCATVPKLLVITRKPVVADKKEVLANPRARSAKLRAGEKRA